MNVSVIFINNNPLPYTIKKMAKKILLILFLISLLIIPAIFADNSQINIKTKPYHRLLVSIYKAGITPPEKITSFPPYKDTKASGQLSLSLSTSEKNVDIKLDLKKDDISVITYDFYDVKTGEPIFINLFPPDNMTISTGNPVVNTTPNTTADNSNATNITNTTIENISVVATSEPNITVTKNITSSNFSITGYASQFYEKNSKIFFYILIVIGLIVGILIVIFIIRKIPKRDHSIPAPLYHKPHGESSEKSLAEAEKKLKSVQEEIEKIKSKNQALREAERKLEEDRLRVEKLRRGY
jgi:hypothetical protein